MNIIDPKDRDKIQYFTNDVRHKNLLTNYIDIKIKLLVNLNFY